MVCATRAADGEGEGAAAAMSMSIRPVPQLANAQSMPQQWGRGVESE